MQTGNTATNNGNYRLSLITYRPAGFVQSHRTYNSRCFTYIQDKLSTADNALLLFTG